MNTAGMKRLAIATLTFACAFMASAMPTKDELVQAQKLVEDLTADEVRALNAGTKKPVEVAAAQLALADEAETEAGKYLLLQGAFKLYARSADYDAAAGALARMRKEIAGLPPEVVVELVNSEMRRVAAEKAPKVLSIFRDAQRTIKCRKELAAAESAAKARPGDQATQRRLAECHAGLGDWPKALEIFAQAGDEAAKYELDPSSAKGYDALKAANYWWEYSAKDDEPFKVHAAVLYRKGLADGSISGLRKTLAEKRVKQMEGALAAAPDAPSGGEVAASQPKQSQTKMLDLGGGVTMELIYVAPGSFMMGRNGGNSNSSPAHKVTLTKGYWLGKYEVTQRQWKQVMGYNPSKFKGDDLPINTIPWDDCQKFIEKVNAKLGETMVRLPTEAEWEFACRAGADGEFAGTGWLDDMGWHNDNSGGKAHPVGQKQANAWGFHDMHGNVWEWCSDWWGDYADGDVIDPVGPASGKRHVTRGGAFDCKNAASCSVSSRVSFSPFGCEFLGFRLCMNAEGPVGASARGSGTSANSDDKTAEQPSAKVVAPAPASASNGKEISVKLATGVTMDFVPCPAGSFEMGCSGFDQSPEFKHKVTITRPFWIGKYQVTRGVWAQYSRNTRTSDEKEMYGGNNAAMNDISFKEVLLFCDWLNHRRKAYLPKGYVFRLPTEAEWEYALNANGGKPDNPYIKWRDGDKSEEDQIMVTNDDYKKIADKHRVQIKKFYTLPPMTVGTKAPNDWGIYDMLGNGREFVLDTLDNTGWTGKYQYDELTGKGVLLYKESETDPLRFVANPKTWRPLIRGGKARASWYEKGRGAAGWAFGMGTTFRLVIGPDLLKERGIKLPDLGK